MDPLEVGSGDRRDPDQVPERPRVGGPGVLSGRDGNRKRATGRNASAVAGPRRRVTGRLGGVHSWTFRQIERMLSCLELGARWPRRTDAARAETLLDDYRKRS